jgi:hypothetical protein
MPEVPDPSKHHSQPQPIRRVDDVLILNRPPWLDHCRYTSPGYGLKSIGERKERAGGGTI